MLTAAPCLHQGFMLRAVSSQGELCPEHLTFEVELLAVLDMAGFLFSLGLRISVAFGLLVRAPLLAQWRCLPPNLSGAVASRACTHYCCCGARSDHCFSCRVQGAHSSPAAGTSQSEWTSWESRIWGVSAPLTEAFQAPKIGN